MSLETAIWLRNIVLICAVAIAAAFIFFVDYSSPARECQQKGGRLFGNGQCVKIDMQIIK